MKVLAINGSPRKKWNTATLLNNVLEGAASQGAETSRPPAWTEECGVHGHAQPERKRRT